jgi:GNAT superfamily N-acetyltransferase
MSELTIKPVTGKDEYLTARDLATRVFHGDDPETLERSRASAHKRLTWPGFDYAWHRIGIVDDRIVAHVSMWPQALRYGRTALSFGAIGAVCTHPDYRGRGYATAVMNDAINTMTERGDLLSFLVTGAEGFYSPLGYHNVWPFYDLEIQADQAAKLDAPLASRPATADDWPQMAQLYEQGWGHRVSMQRPPALWQWRMTTMRPRHTRVVERDGQMVGYIAGDDLTGQRAEVVVATPDAARTLLAETALLRQAAGHDTLHWQVSPDDPLLHYARHWLWCKLLTSYSPRRDWMGRIVNSAGLRDAILPEMLAHSRLDQRGLIFDVQPDQVYIGLRGQDTTNVQLDHNQFLPVMLGTLPPSTLDLQPDAIQLLEKLFPPRMALLAGWDWF